MSSALRELKSGGSKRPCSLQGGQIKAQSDSHYQSKKSSAGDEPQGLPSKMRKSRSPAMFIALVVQ